MRVVIHVGASKTGSTALQRSLDRARDALRLEGVLYSATGTVSWAHHLIAAALHDTAWQLHTDALPGDHAAYATDALNSILREARQEGCHTVLLSSEYFWSTSNYAALRTLRAATAGCEVTVVAFVREIDPWLASTYLQAVKSGYARSVYEYFRVTFERDIVSLDVLLLLARWADGLSAQVVVLPYVGRDSRPAGTLGAVLGVASLGALDAEMVNPSPGRGAVRRLLALNADHEQQAGRAAGARAILAADARDPDRRSFRLPASLARLVPDAYRHDLARLMEHASASAAPLTGAELRRRGGERSAAAASFAAIDAAAATVAFSLWLTFEPGAVPLEREARREAWHAVRPVWVGRALMVMQRLETAGLEVRPVAATTPAGT